MKKIKDCSYCGRAYVQVEKEGLLQWQHTCNSGDIFLVVDDPESIKIHEKYNEDFSFKQRKKDEKIDEIIKNIEKME